MFQVRASMRHPRPDNTGYKRRKHQPSRTFAIALHSRIDQIRHAMKTALLLTAAALCAGNAFADTLYKCSDRTGTVLFTNQRSGGKNCVVLSSIRSNADFSNTPRRASATPTPDDFPRVSSDKQKERDNTRRTILEQELSNEQQGLDAAQKENNASRIVLHQRNIAALQKEIGNLK